MKQQKYFSYAMKNLTLWSNSGHQNNAWVFVVYKTIINGGKSVADITRKLFVNMDHMVEMALPQK